MLTPLSIFAANCSTFLGIPTWYEYLAGKPGSSCGSVNINSLNDTWLIGLAILDMLLSIATLAGIGFFIFGTFQLITARGNPESIAKARSTMVNALIGVAIAFLSTTIVSYVAARIG